MDVFITQFTGFGYKGLINAFAHEVNAISYIQATLKKEEHIIMSCFPNENIEQYVKRIGRNPLVFADVIVHKKVIEDI